MEVLEEVAAMEEEVNIFCPFLDFGFIHLEDKLSFWDKMFRPQGKFSGQIFPLRARYFGLKWHFVL